MTKGQGFWPRPLVVNLDSHGECRLAAHAPRRTRTYNKLIKRQGCISSEPDTCLGVRCPSADPFPFPFPSPAEIPPDLAEVVSAWPDLAEPIRAGILALIRASGEGRPR